MLRLSNRIGTSNHRSGLDQAKLPLAKEPSALSGPQLDAVGSFDMRGQCLPVPQIAAQSEVRRPFSQRSLYFGHLLRTQPAGASRALSFPESRQARLFEATHPVFDSAGRITQQGSDLATTHALSHQQHAVQPVIIARFLVSSNLVLQPKYNSRWITDGQCLHAIMKAQFANIRNYLWPRV